MTFRSHLDGSEHFLSPEKALEIEIALGADIVMVLDECIEAPAHEARTRDAAARTLELGAAVAGNISRSTAIAARQMIFGIVQGGTHARAAPRKRRRAGGTRFSRVRDRRPGGGRIARDHVRNGGELRRRGLPAERPRYLMGVGKPEQIPDYVALGIDMMDCVLPTRSARHGCLFTSQGRLLIKNAQYANDPAAD